MQGVGCRVLGVGCRVYVPAARGDSADGDLVRAQHVIIHLVRHPDNPDLFEVRVFGIS